MKSIRLSLLIYFLVLLALALGSVVVLVYTLTQKSLRANEVKMANFLEKDYQSRRTAELAKVDSILQRRAQTLADLLQVPTSRNRLQPLSPVGLVTAGLNPQSPLLVPFWLGETLDGHRVTLVRDFDRFHNYYSLGVLGTGPTPNGHVLQPVWLAEGTDGPLGRRLHRGSPVRIQFNENDLPGNAAGQETEYSQICSDLGTVWQSSRSLGTRSLTVAPDTAKRLSPSKWEIDETELGPDLRVRRITYKAVSAPRYLPMATWGGRLPSWRGSVPGSRPGPGSGPQRPFMDRAAPVFFIQCAIDTTQHEQPIANLRAERDRNLAELPARSNATLASLRDSLLWISIVAFVATAAGGFLLVHIGLSPLRRLSEAVSRVSTRDFRLPYPDRHLPSELQPIVERLDKTLEMLKRAFAREKQAAADISHELRTPLTALLTTIDVALRKQRSPEEYRELFEDCRTSGQQIGQLLERLLALARLDAGVDSLRPQQVNMTALTEQCAALVRPLAEAHQLCLRVHPHPGTYLYADPDKLREILTNLLHNAIHYNRPNGSIDLEIERQNGHMHLSIRDTGIGISPEAREHVFERFYRADPARHADGLHAGLGLAIVKGYVDLMGGTITVESIEGEGSTFRVELPVGSNGEESVNPEKEPAKKSR